MFPRAVWPWKRRRVMGYWTGWRVFSNGHSFRDGHSAKMPVFLDPPIHGGFEPSVDDIGYESYDHTILCASWFNVWALLNETIKSWNMRWGIQMKVGDFSNVPWLSPQSWFVAEILCCEPIYQVWRSLSSLFLSLCRAGRGRRLALHGDARSTVLATVNLSWCLFLWNEIAQLNYFLS